jgi:hypothetical protein
MDLVRSICAAWERGDFSSIEWADPEIEYAIVGGVTPGTWTGVADMITRSREQLDVFETFRIEVNDYRELDDEQVLVLWDFRGRAKASGLEPGQFRATGAYLFEIREGKVIKLVYNANRREQVLADLGLTPEAGSAHS